MTDPVPATAPGLPAFDRRAFLATLAAAGVMGVEPPATAAEQGDADLFGLLALIGAAVVRQDDFDARSDAAFADLYRAPPIPDAMFWRRRDFMSVWVDHSQLEGVTVGGEVRLLYDGELVLRELRGKVERWRAASRADRNCSDTDIARAEEIIAAVEAWQAEDRAALEACGYAALDRAAHEEAVTIATLAGQMAETRARTVEGICAKARAAGILGSADPNQAVLLASLVVDAVNLDPAAPAASSERSVA